MADDDLLARIEAAGRSRDAALLARIEGMGRQPAAPATPQRGVLEQAARLPVQAAAGINDRAADVLGAPVDLLTGGLNLGIRGVNAAARGLGIGPQRTLSSIILEDGGAQPQGLIPQISNPMGGSDSIRSGLQAITGQAPKPEGTLEELARGGGRGLVDAASFMVPGMAVARTARVGTLAQRTGAALSASPGLQVASGVAGGAVGEATDNPLLGAAAALAAPLGAAGAARMISPIQNTLSPARAALVQAAEREGIPLSTGQATGSRVLQNMEASFAQLPGTSGAEAAFGQEQARAFNRAAMLRAGETADSAGPDALNAARQRIGQDFTDLTARNTLDASPPAFLNRLVTASDNARRYAASDVERSTLNRIDDVLGKVETGDTIPGQAYRELDSELGRAIRGTQNGDLRTHLGEVRTVLRDAMDASISPADQAAWQTARREYANFKTIERAMSGAGGGVAEGNISPLALRNAVNQGTGGGYALGRGDLNELARIGQGVLRAPPDSGTAGRSSMNALLTGALPSGGAGAGALIGGPVGAAVGAGVGLALPSAVRAVYTNRLMQDYLRNQAVRPATRQAITGYRNNVLLQQTGAALND